MCTGAGTVNLMKWKGGLWNPKQNSRLWRITVPDYAFFASSVTSFQMENACSPVAADVLAQCLRALVDQAPRIALDQADDASQLALAKLRASARFISMTAAPTAQS